MNDVLPNPLKDFIPRANPPKPVAQEDSLSRLDSLTSEELIALIRRLPSAATALLTQEEIAEAMLTKLAHTALTSNDTKDTLAAINGWLDRVKGKPVQPLVGNMKLTYEPLVIRGMTIDG